MRRPTLRNQLAANLSTLFTEKPFIDRFRAAQQAGFAAVEIQYPYAISAEDVRSHLDVQGLQLVLFNAPAGDADEKGFACSPRCSSNFRASIDRAIDYAQEVRCPRIHVLCGRVSDDPNRASGFDRAADRFAWAVERAGKHGIEIVVEALNQKDTPGYLLRHIPDAVRFIQAVASRVNVPRHPGLLLDVFHAARNGEPIVHCLERYNDIIAHIQIADHPDRGAPGTGTLPWNEIFSFLNRTKYNGWIGCEYLDASVTEQSLTWRDTYLSP